MPYALGVGMPETFSDWLWAVGGLPPFSGPLEVRVKAVVWPCAAEGEA